MHPYRVFVSYSHDDQVRARRVVDHLRCAGLRPIEFLGNVALEDVRVAICDNQKHPRNQLLVGDWFFAESHEWRRPRAVGWARTVLTRHALTVLDRIDDFDNEFARLPNYQGGAVIDELRRLCASA